MDKDVLYKSDRLVQRYSEAAGKLNLLLPQKVPSGRAATRARNQAVDALGQLQEARKAPASALVRLAYVRAMRASQPQAHLEQDQQHEVETLEEELDERLGVLEYQALVQFHGYLRRIRLRSYSRVLEGTLPQPAPYPLEQNAHAVIRNVVDKAYDAGTLAVTDEARYDGAEHAA